MFCDLNIVLGISGGDEVSKLASVESSAAMLWILSFIQTFDKCLLTVFCVRRCALHFKLFKILYIWEKGDVEVKRLQQK